MRRWLLFLLVVLLFGSWLGHKILRDPGYILIAYDDLTVETSLWIGLLLFVLGVVALYVVIRLMIGVRTPARGLRQWRQQRRNRLATENMVKGLIELSEGRWKQSQRHLLRAAEHSGAPLVNYLAAARAAHAQGQEKETQALLQKAQDSTPDADMVVGLTQAQMQLEDGQWEQAQATLMRLREKAPRHVMVLKLLKRACLELEDWNQLHKLLPDLSRHGLVQPDEVMQLESRIYSGLVREIGQSERPADERLGQLAEVWERMPASLHSNEPLVMQYVHLLLQLNAGQRAETVLVRALNSRWNSRLVEEYGLLHGTDAKRQLKQAETWLEQHPNDADLLLTLGRLCLRNQLWGKACDYMERSLKLRKSAEVCAELARLYEHLGDRQKSQRCFTESLQLLNHSLPQLPMPNKAARS